MTQHYNLSSYLNKQTRMSSDLIDNVILEDKNLASTCTFPQESPRHSSSENLVENGNSTLRTSSGAFLLKAYLFESSFLYYTLLTIIIACIALASIHLHGQISNSHSKLISKLPINETEESPCGSNANSARDAGCNFDPLTFAWLPPACYDWNLTSEFISIQDWEYYRLQKDGSRRQLSLINVMQSSDEVLYVSWEYHRQHCAYLWLKMHRAMLERRPIDGVSMMDIITGVCEGVMRSERVWNDTSVPGYIRYPSCKRY